MAAPSTCGFPWNFVAQVCYVHLLSFSATNATITSGTDVMNTGSGPIPPVDTVKLNDNEVPAQVDNPIALHLHLWPALSIAI